MMAGRAVLIAAAVLAARNARPVPLAAQGHAPLAVGSRVRVVSSPANGRPHLIVKGRLVWLEDDSVAIDAGDERAGPRVERFDLRAWRLERYAGIRGHGGRGALLGAAAGTATMGLLILDLGDCDGWCHWDAGAVVGVLSIGAVGGAAIGFVTGSLRRSEHWVPVRSGVRISLTPRRVGVRVEF